MEEYCLHQLVEACIAGEPEAQCRFEKRFRSLVRRAVYSAFRHATGGYGFDDLVNEAFWRVFEVLPRWNGGTLSAFVYSIARNRAIDVLRVGKRSDDDQRDLWSMAPIVDPPLGPLSEVLTTEQNQIVRDAVSALSAPLREVVHLRFWEKLTFEEIAEKLGIAKSTARVQLNRAFSELHYKLRQKD